MNLWRSFLFTITVIFLISYGAIYCIAASRLYCNYTVNIADVAPCYKYDISGVDAEVLLVGDSSLLYAIRPTEVAGAGGPSTYNYGLVGPAFAFDPAASIEHYLAKNARPRAIVLYFSPWDKIEPGRLNDPRWFPAAVLALQHGGVGDFARLVRARLSAIAEIPPTVVRSLTTDPAISRSRRLAMEADGGRLDFARLSDPPNQSLEGRCPAPQAAPTPIQVSDRMRHAFAELRARYGSQGIPFYIYVAPSAACDRAIGAIRTAYAGLTDNVPLALPDRFFVADPTHQHVHVDEEGATATSILLARFLQRHPPQAAAR